MNREMIEHERASRIPWRPRFGKLKGERRANYLAGYSDAYYGYSWGTSLDEYCDENPVGDYKCGFLHAQLDEKESNL